MRLWSLVSSQERTPSATLRYVVRGAGGGGVGSAGSGASVAVLMTGPWTWGIPCWTFDTGHSFPALRAFDLRRRRSLGPRHRFAPADVGDQLANFVLGDLAFEARHDRLEAGDYVLVRVQDRVADVVVVSVPRPVAFEGNRSAIEALEHGGAG